MNWRMFLIVPALLLGAGIFYLQQRGDGEGDVQPVQREPAAVQAVNSEAAPLNILIEGHGRVEPVRTWEAVSQVDGRVLSTFPDLAKGVVVKEGTELIRIDPRSYEIARDRAAANLEMAQAQIKELDAQTQSVSGQLDLERRIEAVLQGEVDRRRELVERRVAAEATLDQAERDLIAQQRRVLDLENQLILIPTQRISAEATERTRKVELEEAERNLANTVITAPFTGRVLEEDVASGEYVRPGDRLVTIAGQDAVEIAAEIHPRDMGDALPLLLPDRTDIHDTLDFTDQDAVSQILKTVGFQPVVQLTRNAVYEYPAEIVRVDGTIDEATGTIGIVVRVENANAPDIAARRPPLINGDFVTVAFRATSAENYLSVPRDALQRDENGTFVYVGDASDSLARREARRVGRANGRSVIEVELAEGDRIILSAPEPAILGQALTPMDEAGTNLAGRAAE